MGITISKFKMPLSREQKKASHTGDIQWELVKSGAWQCCCNCAFFSTVRNVCTFEGKNLTPPPHIIIVGCENYDDDFTAGIPGA